jgi:hypothetical protein
MTPAKGTRGWCRRGCGRETSRAGGVCYRCERGAPAPVPQVETLGGPAIVALIGAGITELRRRRLEEDDLLRQLVEELAARERPRALAAVPAPAERGG